MDWTLEIIGIFIRPLLLAGSFTCLSALRLTAIRLFLGVTIVRSENIFAAPALPISFEIHYPAPPGKSWFLR
jgi:hypothetical protein